MNSMPIVFCDGDKGGVGKSIVCGAFADWALAKGIPVAVVDGDARNPDVSRIFTDVVPVCLANLRSHDGWMDMVDFIMENPEALVLVSMPAGSGNVVTDEATRFMDMAREAGRKLSLLWVINRTLDSINLLNSATAAFGNGLATKYVLKNTFFGEPVKFRRWDDSETNKRFVASGGKVLNFPELHERTMDKLFADPDSIMPYSQAVVPIKEAKNSVHKLSPSEVVELRDWLGQCAGIFNEISAAMGISVSATAKAPRSRATEEK